MAERAHTPGSKRVPGVPSGDVEFAEWRVARLLQQVVQAASDTKYLDLLETRAQSLVEAVHELKAQRAPASRAGDEPRVWQIDREDGDGDQGAGARDEPTEVEPPPAPRKPKGIF